MLHFSLYVVHFSFQFSFYIFHFILHTSPFTLHSSLFTVHTSPFTLHTSPFTLHRSHFTVHSSPFTLHRSLFTNRDACPVVLRRPDRFLPFLSLKVIIIHLQFSAEGFPSALFLIPYFTTLFKLQAASRKPQAPGFTNGHTYPCWPHFYKPVGCFQSVFMPVLCDVRVD
jgi:hypothetical protein